MRFLFFLLVFVQCSPIKNSESEAKHTWGETSRDNSNFAFEDCVQEEFPDFPKTLKLLRESTEFLMEANRDVFKGNLDSSKFCYKIDNSMSYNAFAIAETRTIGINLGFLYNANEVERQGEKTIPEAILAVLGHELAHVSMLHGGDIDSRRHPRFHQTAEYKILREKYQNEIDSDIDLTVYREYTKILYDAFSPTDHKISMNIDEIEDRLINVLDAETGLDNKEMMNAIEALKEEYMALFPLSLAAEAENAYYSIVQAASDHSSRKARIEDLTQSMMNEVSKQLGENRVGEAYNWTEQEADEAGFEFFTKAGLHSSHYFNTQLDMAFGISHDASTVVDCVERAVRAVPTGLLKTLLEENLISSRGDGSHPASCWRVQNIVNEMYEHKNKTSKIAEVSPDVIHYFSQSIDDSMVEVNKFLINELMNSTNSSDSTP